MTTKRECKEQRSEAAIGCLFGVLQEMQRTDPVYFAEFDDANVDTTPRATLIDLMVRAPNEQVRFFLFGKLSSRIAICHITGRPFV